MTDRNTTLQRDLGRHLQQSLGDLLTRHMAIVGNALQPADAVIMLIEVPVSTALTAASSAAATCEDPAKRDGMFDFTLASIAKLAAGDRDRALAAVAAKLAEAQS